MGLVDNKIRDILNEKYISDIQKLNPTKEELEWASKQVVSEAVSRIVNDIKYPLNPITGYFK